MKHILTLVLCFAAHFGIAQQPAGYLKTVIRSGQPDTTKVVYDEQGKALKYHEYMPMVRSGQYKLRYNGDPSLPETKGQLIKMTVADRQRVDSIRMYGLTTPNDGILQKNTALDVMPLSRALQKDFFSRKAILMLFWDPGIARSMAATIQLSIQLRNYNRDSLIVLFITTADKTRAGMIESAASSINARIVSDAQDIFDAYQVTATPLYVVVDQDRIIRHSATGTGYEMASRTKEVLDEVLGLVPKGMYTLTRDPKYSELSKTASNFYRSKNYQESAKAYEAVIEYTNGNPLISDFINAASSWAHLGDKDKAFHYLTQAVSVHKWPGSSFLTTSEHFESLRSDRRWQELLDKAALNKSKLTPGNR